MSSEEETPSTLDPVLAAIRSGDTDVVRAAGKEAAAVCDPDNGKPGLVIAANAGHAQVVKVLLEAGVQDAAAGASGWTAAMGAAFRGHAEVLAVLTEVSGKEAVLVADPNGATALMLAASRGHVSCVKQLLDLAPESLDAVDVHGRSALIWAVACNDNQEVIRLLVDRGAKIDAPSADGRTPLIWAVLAHQSTSVEALAILGADPDLRDVDKSEKAMKPGHVLGVGQTALDHASNVNTRDPVLRIIYAYLHEWTERRKLDPTAPAKPMSEHPWVTHAKEATKKAEEEAAEAARLAAEAPIEATGAPASADDSDIFGDGDAVEDITEEVAVKATAAGFEACSKFTGRRDGAVFKLGEHGLGYYSDAKPETKAAGGADGDEDGDLDDLD